MIGLRLGDFRFDSIAQYLLWYAFERRSVGLALVVECLSEARYPTYLPARCHGWWPAMDRGCESRTSAKLVSKPVPYWRIVVGWGSSVCQNPHMCWKEILEPLRQLEHVSKVRVKSAERGRGRAVSEIWLSQPRRTGPVVGNWMTLS